MHITRGIYDCKESGQFVSSTTTSTTGTWIEVLALKRHKHSDFSYALVEVWEKLERVA